MEKKGTSAGDTGTRGMLSLFITFLYSYCQASIFLQFYSPVHISKNLSSQHSSTLPLPKRTLPPPKCTHPLPQAQYLVHLHVSWMMTMTKASQNHSLLSRTTALLHLS